jgi:hypothetical protein
VAFDLLRRASQSRHAKLRDVARDVVRRRGLESAPAAPIGSIAPSASNPRPVVRRRPVPTPPNLVTEQIVELSQEKPRVSG